MKTTLIIITVSLQFAFSINAQNPNIVETIDQLTLDWDETALSINSYQGIRKLCKNSGYRIETKALLKNIHHYDSVLYKIVKTKYDNDGNKEAKKTLDDIILLENNYTTKAFLNFLHNDCNWVNEIENNTAGDVDNAKEIKKLEKELSKYISAITKQIDIIDKHIHHMEGL